MWVRRKRLRRHGLDKGATVRACGSAASVAWAAAARTRTPSETRVAATCCSTGEEVSGCGSVRMERGSSANPKQTLQRHVEGWPKAVHVGA